MNSTYKQYTGGKDSPADTTAEVTAGSGLVKILVTPGWGPGGSWDDNETVFISCVQADIAYDARRQRRMAGRKAAGSAASPTLKRTQGWKGKRVPFASCGGKTSAATAPWSTVAWCYPEQDDRSGFSWAAALEGSPTLAPFPHTLCFKTSGQLRLIEQHMVLFRLSQRLRRHLISVATIAWFILDHRMAWIKLL